MIDTLVFFTTETSDKIRILSKLKLNLDNRIVFYILMYYKVMSVNSQTVVKLLDDFD